MPTDLHQQQLSYVKRHRMQSRIVLECWMNAALGLLALSVGTCIHHQDKMDHRPLLTSGSCSVCAKLRNVCTVLPQHYWQGSHGQHGSSHLT